MILTDSQIKDRIEKKEISITPFEETQVESGNYRIRLGAKILIPKKGMRVNLKNFSNSKENLYDDFDLSGNDYILKPGEFILAQTLELISLKNNIAALLDGRSTFARLGVTIHQSSQYIAPGQDPHAITLELFNASPFEIELSYGVEAGKLIFFEFSEDNDRGYKEYGVYLGNKTTTGAVIS